MLRAMSSRLGAHAKASVIALAVLAGACQDPDVDRMTQLTHDACACKTSACADAVMHKVGDAPVAASRKTQALAREMLSCVAKRHDEDLPADDGSGSAP
jgi:hypothetical protein